MKSRSRLILLCIVGLTGLQAALWFGYRTVTKSRKTPPNVTSESLAGRPVPLDAQLLTRSGGTVTLAEIGASRPILLHFWATWCAPCQEELPTLLDLAKAPPGDLKIALVSLDQEWRPVEVFFQGAVPSLVMRDAGALAPLLGVSVLPDTYLLAADGSLLARFHGARDWSSTELQGELRRWLDASP